MKSRFLVPAVVVMLAFVAPSCGGDGRTQPNPAPSICFTVSGFNVTVANIWTGGAGHNVNVQGLVAFDETTSSAGESHTLQWTNIQNNYTTFTVVSFNVRIDGKNYSYPANRCT